MRLSGWALKTGVMGLTVLATLGSTGFVSHHLKNPAAPLHPAVNQPQAAPPSPSSDGQMSSADGGLPATATPPVTSTYAS